MKTFFEWVKTNENLDSISYDDMDRIVNQSDSDYISDDDYERDIKSGKEIVQKLEDGLMSEDEASNSLISLIKHSKNSSVTYEPIHQSIVAANLHKKYPNLLRSIANSVPSVRKNYSNLPQ